MSDMIRGQLYRWKPLLNRIRGNWISLRCVNCYGNAINYCTQCEITVCSRCMWKYFEHKDVVVIGVEL